MDSRKRLQFFKEVDLGDVVQISYRRFITSKFIERLEGLEGQVYSLSPRAVRLLESKKQSDVFMDRCWYKTKRISLAKIDGYKILDKYFDKLNKK